MKLNELTEKNNRYVYYHLKKGSLFEEILSFIA